MNRKSKQHIKTLILFVTLIYPSLLCVGNASAAGSEIVIEGQLTRETLEGGFWTLKTDDGKLYDLHGDVTYKDGNRLRIKGITPQGISCIHMKGTIFVPTSTEKIASAPAVVPVFPPAATPATWKLVKDTFTCYGADGTILWQENKVQYFKTSQDGRVCVLARHLDPKGGKKRRDYATVYRDGKAVFEFYDAPVAVTYRKEEVPIFLTPDGRFGWIQDTTQTIFFDTRMKNQRSFKGEGFAEISEEGTYKVWGMKFGGTYTMLRQEGKFE